MKIEGEQQLNQESGGDRGVRVHLACMILIVLLVSIALPMYLRTIDGYNQARLSLGIDFLLISHPLLRVIIVLLGYFVVRQMLERSTRDCLTLGLMIRSRRVWLGIGLGLICTVPMLAIGLMGGISEGVDYRYLYQGTLVAAFNEELAFRAFGFGLLVQAARMKLWPAAVVTGILFGAIHIDFTPSETETIWDQLNVFLLLTTLGGVLYAWLFHRTRFNLWFVMSIHFFMNLWWAALDVDGSFMGGIGATLSRVLCVTMAILLSIYLYPGASTIGDDSTAEHS